MKKTLITLFGLALLSSCSNDETLEKITPSSPISEPPKIVAPSKIESKTIGDTTYITKIIPTEYKLYKESVKNQRSGIFFQWQGNVGVNPLYLPQKNSPGKSFFGGGEAYGDVNKDGYMDFLVSVHDDNDNSELRWFLNDGDNYNFKQTTTMFNQSTKGLNAHKILKTDVNNDGIADYIALGVYEPLVGDYDGNFSVLIGKSNGTFDVNTIPNPTKYWFHNGAAGDLNGDGFVDVITATFIWLGDGKGNFIKSYSMDTKEHSYCNSPLVYEIADMNGDGLNDILLSTGEDLDKTTIIFNNINKFDSTNRLVKLEKTNYLGTMDIELYDIDTDGDIDIIDLRMLGGAPDNDPWNPKYSKTKLFVYLNNGGSFQYVPDYIQNSEDGNYLNGNETVGIGYQDRIGWGRIKFDDIDGDGIDDIIPENAHDGKFNGLKKINGVWKQHIFSFQKCKK
jgi:hypothetical protein